jgi:hypothetical protein
MLGENGSHLFISCKCTVRDFFVSSDKISFLFGRQLIDLLVLTSQAQQNLCKIILHFGRKRAGTFDGNFQKFGHLEIMHPARASRKSMSVGDGLVSVS